MSTAVAKAKLALEEMISVLQDYSQRIFFDRGKLKITIPIDSDREEKISELTTLINDMTDLGNDLEDAFLEFRRLVNLCDSHIEDTSGGSGALHEETGC